MNKKRKIPLRGRKRQELKDKRSTAIKKRISGVPRYLLVSSLASLSIYGATFLAVAQLQPEKEDILTHKISEDNFAPIQNGNLNKSKFCDIMVNVGNAYNDRFNLKSGGNSNSFIFTKQDCESIAQKPTAKQGYKL